jgi:S1-C subfamily serine protease
MSGSTSTSTSTSSLEAFSADLARLTAEAGKCVVGVHSHRFLSTGFVWRAGLIVAANEAIAEEGGIVVELPGGAKIPATIAGRDPTTDIALLRVDSADLQPAALSSASIAAGAVALAVGARDGAPSAALGVIAVSAGAWRSLRGGEIDARIELDLSLRREAEGGVVVDASGHAFGMVVFGPRRCVLVIPAATIERVATKLESDGRIARGYLGLSLQPVGLEGGTSGLMTMTVDTSGPGAAAGIRQGDVIVAWNGAPIRSWRAALRGLGPESVGSKVALSVRRGGEPVEVEVVIGERPI